MEEPLTVAQVAALLHCTVRTVERIPKSALPYFKTGKPRLYLPSSVQAYMLARSGIGPTQPKEKKPCGSRSSNRRRSGMPAGSIQTAPESSFHARLAKWEDAQRKRAARS